MSKKNRRAKAEAEAAVSPAEKTGKQQASRPVQAASGEQEKSKFWVPALLGVLFTLMVCASAPSGIKGVGMVLLLATLVVMLLTQGKLSRSLCWPALIFALYVLMDGISTLYALSGKFALYEFLKVVIGACVVVLILVLEPRRGSLTGRAAGTMLEVAAASAALISVDSFTTRILLRVLQVIMTMFTDSYADFEAIVGNRMVSIFTNANLFAGVAALAILLSLGLLNGTEDRRERWLHLSCLLVTCAAFLFTQSRGAMASLGAAFVVYLLLERGARKANALVLMVETLLVTVAAAVPGFRALGSESMSPLPLLAVLAGAAVLCAVDTLAGRKIAEKLVQRGKLINWIVGGALVLAAAFVGLALTLTGPAKLSANESLYREVKMPAGSYTVSAEADGGVYLNVSCVTKELAMQGLSEELYSGALDGASFEVPADTTAVFFSMMAEDAVTVEEVRYSGAAEGSVKLHYLLLPEGIAHRLQGLFTSQSYVQRTVYVEDGLKLFKRSPIYGLGMGAFENASISIQTYHYESKYVHNHYLQCMIDTGVIGLALFLLLMLSCAWAVVKMWLRREESHPLTAALGAALVYMAIHCTNEIIFSTNYFLPFACGVFALVFLCCGETLALPGREKIHVWIIRGEAVALGVFAVLLGMNLYAAQLAADPTFDSLAMAAHIDPYEKNDHMLSFVYSASKTEGLPDALLEERAKFETKLEKVSSNTIPYYLGESYFNQGRVEDGFRMLEQYVLYTASNELHWTEAFAVALNNYEDTEVYLNGLRHLRQLMYDWNDANVGKITLPDEITAILMQILDA